MKDYPVISPINVKGTFIFCIVSACFASQRKTEVCPSMETLLCNSVEKTVMLEDVDHKSDVRWERRGYHVSLQAAEHFLLRRHHFQRKWYITCSDYDRTNL